MTLPDPIGLQDDVMSGLSRLLERHCENLARHDRGAPKPLPLFCADGEGGLEPEVPLPAMTLGQEMIEDYLSLRLSLTG